MDNTDRSSLPEIDNTGRGRVDREPGFFPGQARPHGDDDGLPTHEEVTDGGSVPQQASESPARQSTIKRVVHFLDNTDRSSLPEMDNTGRGRVDREPGFLPGQARPHGDDDGLPTYEQEEGNSPTHEEVSDGESVSQQSSESLVRQSIKVAKRVVGFLCQVLVWLGLTLLVLLLMWAWFQVFKGIFIKQQNVYMTVGISIVTVLVILMAISVCFDNIGKYH